MSNIAEKIMAAANSRLEGELIFTKEFLGLGSRSAIDKTMSRLTNEGKLIRIGHGIYVSPYYGKFGKRSPTTESVVQSIESNFKETIVANGATEANALGLTTQMPVREVFITSGRSRKLMIGSRQVELKHGNRCQLLLGKSMAGGAIRALDWLGPDFCSKSLKSVKEKLPTIEWETLKKSRAQLPSWMAQAIGQEMAHE